MADLPDPGTRREPAAVDRHAAGRSAGAEPGWSPRVTGPTPSCT